MTKHFEGNPINQCDPKPKPKIRHLNLVKKNEWRRDPGEWQKHPPPWRNEEESTTTTTTVVDHPKKRGARKDAVVSSSLPAVPTVNYYYYNKQQLVAQCLCPSNDTHKDDKW
jgi:hypothetical protein